MTVEKILRVTAIRSQNPRGFGGCIFTGKAVDERGQLVEASSYWVVKASQLALGGVTVAPGQWWKVRGTSAARTMEVNGYQIVETQLDAVEAVLERPSGEHIVSFIADSPAFEGIGAVKARRLWDEFGERLYDLLDGGDHEELGSVLTAQSAKQVVSAWAEHGDSRVLQWLQSQGFGIGLGRKVLKFFGAETPDKLKEDPYRLLSFCAKWSQVDALARTHFNIAEDDHRRLRGAIEEACYRVFAAGHTSALTSVLMEYVQGVLGTQTCAFKWRHLVNAALQQGLTNGSYVVGLHGVQPLGAMVMEREVAQAVQMRVQIGTVRLLPSAEVDDMLRRFESREGITLNVEQQHAIHLLNDRPFALVTGGAGVGKTTVLKALYEMYDRAGIAITQVALAGRAAKRMQEATGRPSSTIAAFLHGLKGATLDGQCVLVVDEASMVDIVTMSHLCRAIGPTVRLVLVGDPAQLMPIGPGLVLHALVNATVVPLAELKVVKRYGGDIAAAALSIRGGHWPSFTSSTDAPISFTSAGGSGPATYDLRDIVLRLYQLNPSRTQILCARRGGIDGSTGINSLCQTAMTASNSPVLVWSSQHDQYVHTGLRLGDQVLCTRNLWDRGLQNGSLGTIAEVEEEPLELKSETGEHAGFALAWVDWDDGVRRPLVEQMLDDLELGYAITVHKAQGSQWPIVIVPITGHRLMDRTLVYTAITRAQAQVLLVGDEAAARAAVEGLPRAQSRQVTLDLILMKMLRNCDSDANSA